MKIFIIITKKFASVIFLMQGILIISSNLNVNIANETIKKPIVVELHHSDVE